ncbi:hypothetical protein SDC9_166122 [bioreactor metagenome]|uniref:Uncharacterized protein n=1 Tax=bioreactor metagenome TaxID=1076179 RepID=A0A645FYQ3_9ZZZZ
MVERIFNQRLQDELDHHQIQHIRRDADVFAEAVMVQMLLQRQILLKLFYLSFHPHHLARRTDAVAKNACQQKRHIPQLILSAQNGLGTYSIQRIVKEMRIYLASEQLDLRLDEFNLLFVDIINQVLNSSGENIKGGRQFGQFIPVVVPDGD